MFDYKKSKKEGKKVEKKEPYNPSPKVLASSTPKCKFHKVHDRHCVTCN